MGNESGKAAGGISNDTSQRAFASTDVEFYAVQHAHASDPVDRQSILRTSANAISTNGSLRTDDVAVLPRQPPGKMSAYAPWQRCSLGRQRVPVVQQQR